MNTGTTDAEPAPRMGLWRLGVFFVVFAALQLMWQASQGSLPQRVLIYDVTVKTAVALVNWLTPTVHAQASADTVQSYGGGLKVINGCEGVEAAFLLVAAFLVAPISWRSRMLGVSWGLPFVFVVSEARILALFYSHRSNPALFDLLHSTVTPLAVILAVCAYFYAWLRSASHAPTVVR
jgi:exosortase family protein XrtM